MKKKIVALMAIVAVFGLAIAAYAYTQTTTNDNQANASCCKKSDSCPMKNHGAEHAKKEGRSCCDCCGDSCPMKKEGSAAVVTASTSDDKKDCCDSCDCCKGKHETAG